MVTDVSFDNRFKVSSSSFVMLRWREGLLFLRIEVILARIKFADSAGRYFMPDSIDDTYFFLPLFFISLLFLCVILFTFFLHF